MDSSEVMLEFERMCQERRDNCQQQIIKGIMDQLGEGAKLFVELKMDNKALWEAHKAMNAELHEIKKDVKVVAETVIRLDTEQRVLPSAKELAQEIVKLQIEQAGQQREGVGKNKIAEGIIKYVGGGLTLVLALWKVFEVIYRSTPPAPPIP